MRARLKPVEELCKFFYIFLIWRLQVAYFDVFTVVRSRLPRLLRPLGCFVRDITSQGWWDRLIAADARALDCASPCELSFQAHFAGGTEG